MTLRVIKEVGRLNVSMDNSMLGTVINSSHQSMHVLPYVIQFKLIKISKERFAFLILENQRYLTFLPVATDQISDIVLSSTSS